jgi:GNAT superfamily N-acetyltransferase
MHTPDAVKRIAPHRRDRLAPLFTDHRSSFLIDAVLQGHQGTAVADDENKPRVARLILADVVIFGGDAARSLARKLVEEMPPRKAIWPAPGGWHKLLFAIHGERLIRMKRHTLSDAELDVEHLRALAKEIPEGFRIERMGIELARQIVADSSLISQDHVTQFESPEDFVERGIGYAVLAGERIVSGVSSYAVCDRGIEIQVNTHPDFRGRGLATAVSARLLVHCLEAGLEAHWDAGNAISVKLASRLGYISQGTYEMLVFTG